MADRALDLTVDVFATYRLTRLVTADVITEPVRRAVVDRTMTDVAEATGSAEEIVKGSDHPTRLARLITCRWCAGAWIAGGVVVARRAAPTWWNPVARGLAISAAGVLLARFEDG